MAHKALIGDVLEELAQRAVEPVDVEQADRFVVIADLPPGPDFKQLFQRADAAGQGDKTVRQRRHTGFARVHIRHHFQFSQAAMRGFRFNQALGDNADSFTARRQHRVRHDPHQSFFAAAVD
ncbi:Uncharacterised protein [Serratia marcescens]|nr:Uncharacterised protein [Serratia marcescens]CVH57266.1 Uncharacterised protein [Serratia marcescens]